MPVKLKTHSMGSSGRAKRSSPSFLTIATIAAPCAGRAVSGVVAIRACLRGWSPEEKRSRQMQRGFQIRSMRGPLVKAGPFYLALGFLEGELTSRLR